MCHSGHADDQRCYPDEDFVGVGWRLEEDTGLFEDDCPPAKKRRRIP
jgi:hypothetical protein